MKQKNKKKYTPKDDIIFNYYAELKGKKVGSRIYWRLNMGFKNYEQNQLMIPMEWKTRNLGT